MTEIHEIENNSVNQLLTGNDGGKNTLIAALKPEHRDKPQYQRALKRQYAQCHELEHPNIVRYLEMRDNTEYGVCIVMEWQPARTLAEYLKEGHSGEEKKAVVRQIADALAFMHRSNMVHGALNTSNIFVTNQADSVKILNFRFTYADALSEPATTMKFRAPEAKDGTVTLDARTDIFSLGMILKEMDMGDEFDGVTATCSSFTRNNRYADIDAFLDAFEHRRYARREAAAPTGMGTTAGDKRVAILVATIVGLAIVGALLYFNSRGSADEQAQTELATETTVEPQPIDHEIEAQPGQQPAADSAQPQAATGAQQPQQAVGSYSGELEFLNTLVPQMRQDLDKIYASTPDPAAAKAKVSRYYRGLRKVLGSKTEAQFAAFDKEFADYVKAKTAL